MKRILQKILRAIWGGDDVVISGYYGYGSLGDEAVLDSIVAALLEKIPTCKIGVLSAGHHGHCCSQSVRRIRRKNPLAILWALLRCRLLISGGGSLFQDTTSRRSLFYYTTLIRIANVFGVRVFVYANGIGPLAKCKSVQAALRCADVISVRDPDSFYAVLAMGIDCEKVFLRADPVFLLSPAVASAPPAATEKPYFVVSLRTCCNGKIEEEVVVRTCRALKERGLEPVFVSMQDTFDREVCLRVCRRCGGVMADKMSVPDFTAFLAGARFVISMRLHCILLAALSGTPAIALSYDCKIDSAMEYLGQYTALDAFFFTEDMLLDACEAVSYKGEGERKRLRERSGEFFHLAQKDANMAAGLLTAGAAAPANSGNPVSAKL